MPRRAGCSDAELFKLFSNARNVRATVERADQDANRQVCQRGVRVIANVLQRSVRDRRLRARDADEKLCKMFRRYVHAAMLASAECTPGSVRTTAACAMAGSPRASLRRT